MAATADHRAAQEAVTRLYDLVRSGEVDNVEFNQLDSLVYSRLLQTYDCDRDGLGCGGESIS
ncbi:MAG: hypothetical protein GX856_12760 [Gammaproteobacteria bacterium]|jgi:hypothetical protein|nr:hypothetical protein [Gammaproteobacteria bacterium]